VNETVRNHQKGETKKDNLYAELEAIRDSANEAVSAAEEIVSQIKEIQGRLEA
jgi:hypothetical protein